jgi:hypothetical protein
MEDEVMSDGNWPDPARPGEPEDASLRSDYLLTLGSGLIF